LSVGHFHLHAPSKYGFLRLAVCVLRPGRPRTIPANDALVAVLVVPTNEELEIAEQTLAVVGG
jgi:hypothetical protein